MLVRRAVPTDTAAVAAVHTAAFPAEPDRPSPEALLVAALQRVGDAVPGLSLVAVRADVVVGHVVCSRGRLDGSGPGRPPVALGPLGVLPDQQRRGVGQALVHAVLGGADALDEPGVVVLGDPAFYSRFGFEHALPLGLLPPDPAWAPHFQLRRLTAWRPGLRGTFRYPAAFDDV